MRSPISLLLAQHRLASDPMSNALLRDTVSLTVLRAGYKVNVIPEQAGAEIDCRLLPDTDGEEFMAWLKGRINDPEVAVEVIESSPPSGIAPVENPFFRAVENGISRHVTDAGTFPMLVPGGTDGRYWRQRGYAAYGFAPVVMERADIGRVHGIDERISIDNLVQGIQIAQEIIHQLCAA